MATSLVEICGSKKHTDKELKRGMCRAAFQSDKDKSQSQLHEKCGRTSVSTICTFQYDVELIFGIRQSHSGYHVKQDRIMECNINM